MVSVKQIMQPELLWIQILNIKFGTEYMDMVVYWPK